MNGPGCECDYAGAGCQVHPTTDPSGWGPSFEDDDYDSYTGMDGYDGPEYIELPRRKSEYGYLYCSTHDHWYSPKYKQCWYCWRGTSKTMERQLSRLEYRPEGRNMSKQEEINSRISELEQELETLKEVRDNRYLTVKEYLHSSNDEYADWELAEGGKEKFDEKVHSELHYRLYEVEFTIEIDTHTGKYKILEVRDGEQVLTPKDSA